MVMGETLWPTEKAMCSTCPRRPRISRNAEGAEAAGPQLGPEGRADGAGLRLMEARWILLCSTDKEAQGLRLPWPLF